MQARDRKGRDDRSKIDGGGLHCVRDRGVHQPEPFRRWRIVVFGAVERNCRTSARAVRPGESMDAPADARPITRAMELRGASLRDLALPRRP